MKTLTDEQIDRIAENCAKGMPDGIRGFCVTWGWRQFACELLDVCAGHERAARLDAAQRMADALLAVARLNPEEESDYGYNEWGEAECFRKAQELAAAALAEWESTK